MRKHDGKIAFMCALALLLSLHADCALAAEAPGMVRCDGRPVYVYEVDSHEVYGRECRVIGVPKTIDNDLFGTDHCPGFASAAKYIATSIMEVSRDAHVYDTGMITIIECMGRHAGWLTAASALAGLKGDGPDFIYLPEVDFDMEKFIADVSARY